MALRIVHRAIAAGLPAREADSMDPPVWRTCLREVTFVDDAASISVNAGDAESLAGAEAYAFLLETICGLRSPMLGETQVLGQFRTFLTSLSASDASWLAAVGQQLMTDARAIRERHLRGLGSRSYGSAVRRHLGGCDVVALIGAGSLASELRPYLAEGRRVEPWTRQDIARVQTRAASGAPAAIVVAAPVRSRAIEQIARCYSHLIRIIDLRSAGEREPIDSSVPIFTLDDLFASVEASAVASAARLEPALREIGEMARAFDRRQQLRPFGWDDLCA